MPEDAKFENVFADTILCKHLSINDGHDNRIMLTNDDDGNASIAMLDMRGVLRMTMTVDANGTPSITLSDRNGKWRWMLTCLGEEMLVQVNPKTKPDNVPVE